MSKILPMVLNSMRWVKQPLGLYTLYTLAEVAIEQVCSITKQKERLLARGSCVPVGHLRACLNNDEVSLAVVQAKLLS